MNAPVHWPPPTELLYRQADGTAVKAADADKVLADEIVNEVDAILEEAYDEALQGAYEAAYEAAYEDAYMKVIKIFERGEEQCEEEAGEEIGEEDGVLAEEEIREGGQGGSQR